MLDVRQGLQDAKDKRDQQYGRQAVNMPERQDLYGPRSQLERHGHSAVGPYSVDHCINLTIQEPPICGEFSAEPYTVTFTNGC